MTFVYSLSHSVRTRRFVPPIIAAGPGSSVCVRAGSVAAKLACVEAVARALWTFLALIGEDFRSQSTWFRVWPITVLNSDADT